MCPYHLLGPLPALGCVCGSPWHYKFNFSSHLFLCKVRTRKKGKFVCLKHFRSNRNKIMDKILKVGGHPDKTPNGYCLRWDKPIHFGVRITRKLQEKFQLAEALWPTKPDDQGALPKHFKASRINKWSATSKASQNYKSREKYLRKIDNPGFVRSNFLYKLNSFANNSFIYTSVSLFTSSK